MEIIWQTYRILQWTIGICFNRNARRGNDRNFRGWRSEFVRSTFLVFCLSICKFIFGGWAFRGWCRSVCNVWYFKCSHVSTMNLPKITAIRWIWWGGRYDQWRKCCSWVQRWIATVRWVGWGWRKEQWRKCHPRVQQWIMTVWWVWRRGGSRGRKCCSCVQ